MSGVVWCAYVRVCVCARERERETDRERENHKSQNNTASGCNDTLVVFT